MYTIVPDVLLFILAQCFGHLPLGDIKDLKNQIKDHDATAKGIISPTVSTCMEKNPHLSFVPASVELVMSHLWRGPV